MLCKVCVFHILITENVCEKVNEKRLIMKKSIFARIQRKWNKRVGFRHIFYNALFQFSVILSGNDNTQKNNTRPEKKNFFRIGLNAKTVARTKVATVFDLNIVDCS